jgi:hypothetical protein
MKTISVLAFIFAASSFLNVRAQDLAAYTDYMGRFYIFDKGISIKFEDQEPQSIKIGGNCILYINSSGHLNKYFNGKVEMLEKGGVTEYYAGDFLASYSIFEKLIVISKGKSIILSNRCTNYYAADSLIAYYDKNTEALKVFYNDKSYEIESGMLGSPVKVWAGSDNIIAYISSRTGDFKIWYRGSIVDVASNVENTRFKAGRDIVAYNNETEQNFQVFFRGSFYTLEDFPAQSFKAGDDFVAYVNQSGEFKVFFKGESYLVSSFPPQSYMAEDNILAFTEDNRFKVWYKGEVIEVESFVPSTYKLDWNTIAYLDNSNRIWIFQNGVRKFFANELVNSFDVNRDIIMLNVKLNRNIIYYKGNFFEGQSFYK